MLCKTANILSSIYIWRIKKDYIFHVQNCKKGGFRKDGFFFDWSLSRSTTEYIFFYGISQKSKTFTGQWFEIIDVSKVFPKLNLETDFFKLLFHHNWIDL